MTVRSLIARAALQEDFNFLVTSRIPRRLVTQFMGWFSKIEQPLIRDLSIGIWRLFADPDLAEAAKPKFSSLHDCFIRVRGRWRTTVRCGRRQRSGRRSRGIDGDLPAVRTG